VFSVYDSLLTGAYLPCGLLYVKLLSQQSTIFAAAVAGPADGSCCLGLLRSADPTDLKLFEIRQSLYGPDPARPESNGTASGQQCTVYLQSIAGLSFSLFLS